MSVKVVAVVDPSAVEVVLCERETLGDAWKALARCAHAIADAWIDENDQATLPPPGLPEAETAVPVLAMYVRELRFG